MVAAERASLLGGSDTERLATGASSSSSSSSSSWRRTTTIVACAALTAAIACAGLVSSSRESNVSGAPTWSWNTKEALTLSEWGPGELHAIKWTAGTGFVYQPTVSEGEFERSQQMLGAGMIKWAVKTYYPGRIAPDQPPFNVFFTVEDFPQTHCLSQARRASGACHVNEWAPVYDFSSAPRDGTLLPSLVPATLITLSQPILDMLSSPSGPTFGAPPVWDQKMFNIEDVPAANRKEFMWSALIPKIVWRGSDYRFLGPEFDDFIEDSCHAPDSCMLDQIAKSHNRTQAMVEMSQRQGITARFRMVLKSLLEPGWLDARFFCIAYYDKRFPMRVKLGKELGVEDDKEMSNYELARYKYQIDLGGAGGTTWTGTIHKLTMPGVLFHHETRMKDSYFDSLKPMVHYIPVKEDLSDLRERFEWAEANPQLCKQISAAASQWVKNFAQRRALLRHNYYHLAIPLGRVIDPNQRFLKPFEAVHPSSAASRGAARAKATARDAK